MVSCVLLPHTWADSSLGRFSVFWAYKFCSVNSGWCESNWLLKGMEDDTLIGLIIHYTLFNQRMLCHYSLRTNPLVNGFRSICKGFIIVLAFGLCWETKFLNNRLQRGKISKHPCSSSINRQNSTFCNRWCHYHMTRRRKNTACNNQQQQWWITELCLWGSFLALYFVYTREAWSLKSYIYL